MADALIELSPHLLVHPGHVNAGVIRDGSRALVIDCGDGGLSPALHAAGIEEVDALLFTHHHRDQACGANRFAGARVIVPAAERRWFEDVTAYWADPASRWHLYDYHPHHLMLAEPLRVDDTVGDGERFAWGPARITAVATPGHTDGGMSYLVEVDGRRVAFTGDLLAGPGQLWELHSLQKYGALGSDYHGFLGARGEVIDSLRRVEAAAPELLVPAHGVLMPDPPQAIAALAARLEACYREYLAVSTVRFYWPERFAGAADDPAALPVGAGLPVPDFLRHVFTSWVLVSEDGAAFVMDCGHPSVVETLRAWQANEEITDVEGLWITHYHDDHVDAVPAFQRAFDCPLIADARVAEVIADPLAWRLPCISPAAARVDRATGDGDRWQWHEFTLTAYHLPGQTLHHGGLLVEGRGVRLFFTGDSFSPAGLDDYCAQNRNVLGAGVGFDRCLALLEELRPDLLFNAHIDVAFAFSAADYRRMRENLARREQSYGALFPWPHANFGMDEGWVACRPYEQYAEPGATIRIDVAITNHAAQAQSVAACLMLPDAWAAHTPEASATVAGNAVAALPLTFTVPAHAQPGRYVLPADILFGTRELPQITEAIVEVR